MPTISQEGVYVAGTYGFPIFCPLSPLVPDIFTNVSAIAIDLLKPDGSAILDRSLPLPDSIIDPNGKLQFIPQQGDLSIDGKYTVRFKVDYSGGAHLVFSGDFTVTEE